MTLKEYLQNKYSPGSISSHYNNVLRYITYMNGEAETAQYRDVLGYISYLRKQGLHAKTLRNYLFAVKSYYSYLQESGIRKDHPCRKLHLKDPINRAIPIESLYSEEQLVELLASYRALDRRLQQRNEVILSLLVYQALNIKEVIRLRMEDVQLEKGEVFIRESMQLKARTLPLKPSQIMLFYNYIGQTRKKILDFYNVENDYFIITKYAKNASDSVIRGVLKYKTAPKGEFTTIKIRQSVICNLLKKNDLRVVQVFAGHRRSSATEAYKQSGLQELKDHINKLHPLNNR